MLRNSDGIDASPSPLLLELGWEVCNKVGGIYTVLRTKAPSMVKRWGDRYTLIGPYNPATANTEFEPSEPDGLMARVIESMEHEGLKVHFGRWMIQGRPRVMLLELGGGYSRIAELKYYAWKDHYISFNEGDGEVDAVLAFAAMSTRLLQTLAHFANGRPTIAHFHEWMAGLPCARIKQLGLPIATVFTTHATLLGRYLASDLPDFYGQMDQINPDEVADKYRIGPRHRIEKAAAHTATVFSTVSTVTAMEAYRLLDRLPDAVLPNGIDITRFEAPHEIQHYHAQFKQEIHQFVMGHFFPSYQFDLDKTIYLFTSGRYEYLNKGLDMFLEALHRLNGRLKDEFEDPPTVVAFIVSNVACRGYNVEVLKNQAQLEELGKHVEQMQQKIGKRIYELAARGKLPERGDLIDEDSRIRLKRSIATLRNTRLPTIVTHDLVDDAGDPVLKHLRHRGLLNYEGDPVKVVFHPQFLSATSPLMSLDYDQFVRGCHMGIFPSYYEPWGYTPLETLALGLPTITTDLSGFGAYVQDMNENDRDEEAALVLPRRALGFNGTTDRLVDHLIRFCKLDRRERIELRNRSERFAENFDWTHLVEAYHDAHDLALQRSRTGAGSMSVKLV